MNGTMRRRCSSHRAQAPRPKPAPQRQDGRRAQHWVRVMTVLQPIVGDAGIELMNLVEADIASELLQYPGQAKMRCAQQRGIGESTVALPRPERVLEAVLYREQPNSDDRRQRHNRQLRRRRQPGSHG